MVKTWDSEFLLKGLVRNGEHILPAYLPESAKEGDMLLFTDGNTYEVVERMPRVHEKSFSMVMRVSLDVWYTPIEEIFILMNNGEWYDG